MTYKKTPIVSIQAVINQNPQGIAALPWAGTALRDYKWIVQLDIAHQAHSSDITRQPFQYNGQDVSVGQWIANTTVGTAWRIISIDSKTTTTVVATVEDVYRYNTYRDPSTNGDGAPALGQYVVLAISDDGAPIIDTVPESGVSADFTINLQSRFQYTNLQYNYPLSQPSNVTVPFVYNDVIAVDKVTHSYVLADATYKTIVGRVTAVDDDSRVFTVNPVQKIVDNLDTLPGGVGDSIYSSVTNPGQLSLNPAGAEVYIKLRDNTQTITYSGDVSIGVPVTTPGNIFKINDVPVTVTGTGTPADIIDDVNLVTVLTGVTASLATPATVATTNPINMFFYGQPGINTTVPATASINGVTVTFDISTEGMIVNAGPIATPKDMSDAIDRENIPNIVTTYSSNTLTISDLSGSTINIINITPDVNGCYFAGLNSACAIDLITPNGIYKAIKFVAVDARAINFYDVTGFTTIDAELESAENGIKAAGLYVQNGLRKSTTTVVSNLVQLNLLTPLIGDQAFVLDSVDATGNNAGEWSMWLYEGAAWVLTSNMDSSTTDAKSLEFILDYNSPILNEIGSLSNNRRVALITVEVLVPFSANATLDIGYRLDYPVTPITVLNGLMQNAVIDLTQIDTYTTISDNRFDYNTDVTILASYIKGDSVAGQAKIVVTYA